MNEINKRFMSWFSARRRKRLLKLIREHARLTIETVTGLIRLIENWQKGDRDSVIRTFNKVSAAEKEADELRRKIVATLMGGVLEPEERSSLLRVIREADWIADWAHEACRIAIVLLPYNVPDKIKEHCRIMAEVTLKATIGVKDALNRIFESPHYIVEVADSVERLEEEVDKLYEDARREFIKESTNLAPGIAVMLAYLLDAIENVADRCEDTCDRLREVAVMVS